MKVRELKEAVLKNMNEKCDDATLLKLGTEILFYINMAYSNAYATGIKPIKRVKCISSGGKIPISAVGEDFFQISRVIDKFGLDTRFSRNSEFIFVADGEYEIEYYYMPEPLVDDEQEPIIKKGFEYILSDYATYRMFLKGSKARQVRGEAFLSGYLNGLSALPTDCNNKIRNKFGREIYG